MESLNLGGLILVDSLQLSFLVFELFHLGDLSLKSQLGCSLVIIGVLKILGSSSDGIDFVFSVTERILQLVELPIVLFDFKLLVSHLFLQAVYFLLFAVEGVL